MSQRNSQAAKTAARERLRVERERQAKKEKTKRQVTVAGAIVAVLAIAGGIGFAVMQANKPSYWEAAKDDKLVAPANTSGKNGTTVVVGKDSAKKTLDMYEDPRCPICATFEQTVGSNVDKDVEAGKYKIQYIGATFIDNSDNGEGSKNALSALGAALNVSPEAFLEYKTALYSKANHPEETDDKFKKDAYLIKVANTVDALKNNKAFQKDVEDGTYDKWALTMSQKFDDSDVKGTPTLKMDGKTLTGPDGNAPMTVADYTAAIDKALKA
ncbi:MULTISPECIES: thioredoxin domain-containing protein [unclassified Streptomyces]|uniref:thioredoxin domain-containing protein n=1 Tax=unclassified Streptomyces TaxID=2593676 RepID=UPI002251CD84|nr:MULTISPECIES: thioredoxin domain-containing protein [unclassified Streptomyces]MCX5436769.1 DsbA family protein [Streptomyces sp. NBC_00063]WSE14511.1 DsbA family protein [Streptomyces sp. NBC_01397]WUB96574.1 DsbA family protein [Streptomyces sp. NBC_00569]